MTRKAQAILEFALAFIIMVALIMGLLYLGTWSADNIRLRQAAFEESRVQAGSNNTPGEPLIPFNATAPEEHYLFKR